MGPNPDWCPHGRDLDARPPQRDDHERTKGEGGLPQPRRGASEETSPADTSSVGLQAPKQYRIQNMLHFRQLGFFF